MERNNNNRDNTMSNAVRGLADIGSGPLVAVAAALDALVFEDFNKNRLWDDYLELVRHIENGIRANDEARFSLYDYLDALFNASGDWFPPCRKYESVGEWGYALDCFRKDPDKAFSVLVDLAADKRRSYEG